MKTDDEGFLYPYIDDKNCVNCGMCERVCPQLHPNEARVPLGVYAAKAKDDALRMNSSSGGMFSLLSKAVLSRGGIVFGAAFDHGDWHVFHKSVDNEVGLAELRGSKYVQSDMGDCYTTVAMCLLKGEEVLFSGTPCQIAGLRNYLLTRHDLSVEKLLLVEVVCHAVPSPFAWRRYLMSRVKSAYHLFKGTEVCGRISNVSFRWKICGCRSSMCYIEFVNGEKYLTEAQRDPFMRGFFSKLYDRPSCHACACRNLRSGADLSIGDYWGVATRFPDFDDDKGTSLVLVNTEKGHTAFLQVSHQCCFVTSDLAHAIIKNPQVVRSPIAHKNRARFFKFLDSKDFDHNVVALLKPSFYLRMRILCGKFLRACGLGE